MPRGRLKAVVQFLRQLAEDGPSDGQLVERFARHRDEEAFAVLIRRHGPMVMGVCRRLLHQEQDAEDVFQATFLVLARKAGAIRKREALGSWLYGVAARLARQARATAARRQAHERQIVDVAFSEPLAEFVWQDLRPVLDEEIEGLPRKYREAFVLCHLEGKTNEQAARELGCPLGTVLSRLSRARELLRLRLNRRGVSLTTGLLLVVLAEHGSAAVPTAFLEPTVKAAIAFAAGKWAAGAVSASAAAMAQGVLHIMFMTRIWIAGAVLLLASIVGSGVYSRQDRSPKKGDDPAPQYEKNDKQAEKSGGGSFSPQYDKSGKSEKRGGFFSKSEEKGSPRTEQPYEDADKEGLRLANKLLQEEIEDEKAKLEALQKKLERLKSSGIKLAPEDPDLAKLKRENRRLQNELQRLQEDVRLADEDVHPYLQKLQEGARNAPGHQYEKRKALFEKKGA
jgi:RNA polymerase sigma factor (sigma-70 family)